MRGERVDVRIDAAQVAVVAIILLVPTALMFLPAVSVELAGRDAWLAVLAGGLLTGAFAWLLAGSYLAPGGEPPGGRLLWLGVAAYAVYLEVLLVAQVSTVMTIVLPEMPIGLFAAGIAATGWALASYGRQAVVRTGQVLFPAMVVMSLANLVLVLAGNADVRELLPLLEAGPGPVVAAVPVVIAFGSELVVLATAAGTLRDPGRAPRTLPVAAGVSALLLAAYTAAATAVLGAHETARSVLPVLNLARQVRVTVLLARLEVLTLFAWLMGAFVKSGLLLHAADWGLVRGLGLGARGRAVARAAVAAGAGFLGVVGFGNDLALLAHVRDVFPVVAGVVLVATALLGAWGRRPRRPGVGVGRGLAGLLVLVAPAALAGCFGRVEPEQAVIPTVLAVDTGRDGRVRLTVEALGAAPGGQATQEPGAGVQRVLLTGQGGSLFDAQRRVELLAAREVLWSHVNFVVLGRQAAAAGTWPLLDSLTRRYTFRRNAFLFVADDDAGDLLGRLSPAFGAPLFTAFQRLSARPSARMAPLVDLNAFLRALAREGEDPVLPVVDAAPPPAREPVLTRVGLFRDDRLVGFLDEAATEGLLWLTGLQDLERLRWPCPDRDDRLGVGVSAPRAMVRRGVGVDGEALWGQARIRIEADVEEWRCAEPLDPHGLAAAEAAGARRVRQRVARMLAATRRLGVDPTGFGAALHRADPARWRVERDRWRERLAELPVAVEVKVRLRRTGLTTRPP